MILVVSNMYPSEEYPNYGVFVKNFCEELEITFPIKILSMKKRKNFFLKLISYLLFYIKVFFHFIFGKYDFIYIHYAGYNSPPILLGKIFNKKTKIIVNVHGSDVTPEKKLEEKTNFLTALLLDKADLIVVPSVYFEKLVKEKYGQNLSTFISPSGGVDTNLFKPKDREITEGKFVLSYVGRIDKEKGWDLLLYAIYELQKKIPNISLIMVGSGDQDDLAKKMIQNLQLNNVVNKLGMLPQEKLVDIYNDSDVFIFPSTRDGESLGLVGIEAMSCGTPVIGSDFGGISTYLENGSNGYLFKPGDIETLKEAILRFKNLSINEREQFSKCALKTAEKYDRTIVNNNLILKLKEMMSGPSIN